MVPDFKIESLEPLSCWFLEKNISSFQEAARFISALPYGRHKHRNDLYAPLKENCGTCSSKHALLKQLASENSFPHLQLIVGIYKMSGHNTPAVRTILVNTPFDHIPEAHCYLKHRGEILDYTSNNSQAINFSGDLLEEIEIVPADVVEFKVKYHQAYVERWLNANPQIKMDLEEVWAIREKCIEALSGK